jgi:hypothetical protein
VPRPSSRGRYLLTDEERRKLLLRQGDLTALTKHPSWAALEDEVQLKTDRLERMVLNKALHDNPIATDELHYLRGFIHGLRWLIAVPTGAESRLESYLRQQGVEVKEEAS